MKEAKINGSSLVNKKDSVLPYVLQTNVWLFVLSPLAQKCSFRMFYLGVFWAVFGLNS